MKKFGVLAMAAVAFLAGCGGSGTGNQAPRVAFTGMVNFGDSLSDVGTYATKLVAANGEGHYSINGNLSSAGMPYTNWTEYLAASLQVAQPCAAETGLESVGQLAFMAQAVADNTNCYSYAQGGAQVTNPYGPGNAFYFTQFGQTSGELGQITKPVAAQIASFLSAHTSFGATELVTVLAGGNDLFIDRALDVDVVVQTLAQQGLLGTAQGNAAIAAAAQKAVDDMTTAGSQLASLVTGQIIANGAQYVVVVNLPDVSVTPDAALWLSAGQPGQAVDPIHPHLTLDMVNAFNAALASGLGVSGGVSSHAEIAFVDAFTASDEQVANPAQFGLTNVTTPACNLDPTSANPTGLTVPVIGFVPLQSSLFCTKSSLITDPAHVTTVDPSGVLNYQFADTVHPTPYAYRLLAQFVAEEMAVKGWL